MTTGLPWRETADGIELTVRVTPRGGQARAAGIVDAAGRPCASPCVWRHRRSTGAAKRGGPRLDRRCSSGIPGARVATDGGRARPHQDLPPDAAPEDLPVRLAALVG